MLSGSGNNLGSHETAFNDRVHPQIFSFNCHPMNYHFTVLPHHLGIINQFTARNHLHQSGKVPFKRDGKDSASLDQVQDLKEYLLSLLFLLLIILLSPLIVHNHWHLYCLDRIQRLFHDNLMILFNRFLTLCYVLLCKINIDRQKPKTSLNPKEAS